jgi:IclR family mhp operon transcriptional activator
VKIPAHESAIGLAFLAFCSAEERATILREAATLGGAHHMTAKRRAALQRELDDIRARGFASTRPWRPSRLHGIAVPILQGPHVLGALSLRYPKSSMTEPEAAARYVPMLCNVADAIVARAFADHTND